MNFVQTYDCIIFRMKAILQLHLLPIVVLIIVIIVKVALSIKGHQLVALANRSSLDHIPRRDLTLRQLCPIILTLSICTFLLFRLGRLLAIDRAFGRRCRLHRLHAFDPGSATNDTTCELHAIADAHTVHEQAAGQASIRTNLTVGADDAFLDVASHADFDVFSHKAVFCADASLHADIRCGVHLVFMGEGMTGL